MSVFNVDEAFKRKLHEVPANHVISGLGSTLMGLTHKEAAERLTTFGRNELKKARGKPLYIKLLANFTHLMAILLWVGGILALIADMPELAIAVCLVNLINGLFSFWQEFRAEKATEALQKMLPSYARVLRDGEESKISAEELVPGDIIFLEEGDHVSADCRVLQQAELRMDQSTLTGESRPVNKTSEAYSQEGITHTELPNLLFAGTNVASGSAKAIVYETGMGTAFGKIAHLTQTVSEDLSPLQKEMKKTTQTISVIAVGVGMVFFLLSVFLVKLGFLESFIFAIGMIVAFVPEGLLPTVTMSLAMATQRMAKRHALIKKLSSVETLGCTSMICTDKTGTLTQNEMTVRHIWLPVGYENGAQAFGKTLDVSGIGYAPEGKILDGSKAVDAAKNDSLHQLLRVSSLCNNARLLPPTADAKSGEKGSKWQVLGDPTEASLIVSARKGGLDLAVEERSLPRAAELPFESRRKRMSTVHTSRKNGKIERMAFVKGAPREVLALCTHIQTANGVVALTDAIRAEVVQANDDYAAQGLRVLAMSLRVLAQGETTNYTVDSIEHDLTFMGLIAMMDPPRPEVIEAVEKCHHAGIRIIMITGDYGLTAESIARQIGIVKADSVRVITGFELENMAEEDLKAAIQNEEVIFARVAPEQKLQIVTAVQQLGHITAVTGDGVNDAPALKKADIGVAMGITGSDVAKEAADMILTDDNFASIVNAIEEGRAVYENIKRFTTYIFTSNTPEAVPFILFAMTRARIPLALNVMHILAVDLGTDIVPALALGAEAPEPGIMNRPPRSINEHLITGKLLIRAYFILGPVQAFATMMAFFYYYWTNGYAGQWLDLPGAGSALYPAATAMALAAVVTTQIGNLFTQRSERRSFFKTPLFNNKLVWIGIASELVVIALVVYVPFFHKFIGTAAFDLKYWPFLFAWVPSLIIVDEIRKMIIRLKDKRAQKLSAMLKNGG